MYKLMNNPYIRQPLFAADGAGAGGSDGDGGQGDLPVVTTRTEKIRTKTEILRKKDTVRQKWMLRLKNV